MCGWSAGGMRRTARVHVVPCRFRLARGRLHQRQRATWLAAASPQLLQQCGVRAPPAPPPPQDPEVIAAVAELKARKDAQAALQAKWDELTGGAIQDTLEDAEE